MSIKLNIVGRRRPGTTLAEHRHHIRRVHGERVLEFIRVDPEHAPRRYVQNAVIDGTYRSGATADDPFALNRDFVTQVWLPDLQTLQRSRETAFYKAWLKDDEDRFVDQANVVFLPCRERVVREGDVPALAWKLFVLMRCTPTASIDTFHAAWSRAAESRPAAGPRHVQNLVMASAALPSPANAIDEFWFADEDAAHAHLATWRSLLQAGLVEPGLVNEQSFVALIAREDVVHAGTA